MNGSRLLMIALCLLCNSVAFAQSKQAPSAAARTEASQHFRRGVELYQEKDHEAALVEFQRAYELAPDYRLLYNIGQAKLEVKDYLGAAQAYDAYLTEGGGAIPPERRTQVEGDLAELKGRVGRVSIYANMDGADVFLDDQKIGTTPISSTVLANVGQHRITARTKDGATDAQMVNVAGGDIAEVALTLIEPQGKTVVVREGRKELSKRRQAALITWGAGGALLIGALVTGLMANGAEDDLKKLIRTDSVRPRAVEDKRNDAKILAATTDVLLTVGIASAATGTLLWFLDKPEKEKKPDSVEKKPAAKVRDVQWGLGLGSVSLRGKF